MSFTSLLDRAHIDLCVRVFRSVRGNKKVSTDGPPFGLGLDVVGIDNNLSVPLRRRRVVPGSDTDLGDVVVLDADATIVVAHSDKESPAPTFKGSFGFHPIAVC